MKKAPVFLLTAAMLLSLAACGGGEASPEGSAPSVDVSTPPVQESAQPAQESENPQTGEAGSQGGDTTSAGQTITLEGVDLELTIGEFQAGDKLGGDIFVSTHSDTNKYFWLSGTLVNVGTETVSDLGLDTMVTLVFDDTYSYKGDMIIRDDIGPFAQSDVYFWADVPPAMLERYESVKVIFGYNDGFADYYNWEKTDYERAIEGYDHQYTFTANS